MEGIKAQLGQCRAILKARGTLTVDLAHPLCPAAKAALHAHMENTQRLMQVLCKIQVAIDEQMATVKAAIGKEGGDIQAAVRQHRCLARHSWTNVAMGSDLHQKSRDQLRVLRKRCGGWAENRRFLRTLRVESNEVLSCVQKDMESMRKLVA
tara:strand:+ start:467 stop:922 length:456 start_codon:yes stop_codon:yes gene_type:complete